MGHGKRHENIRDNIRDKTIVLRLSRYFIYLKIFYPFAVKVCGESSFVKLRQQNKLCLSHALF